MNDYPQMIARVDHIEPVPRRIRATLGRAVVLDSCRALYVWEWPNYPQYYIPLADVDTRLLVDEHREERSSRGTARQFGLRAGSHVRPRAARMISDSPLEGLADTVRFDWDALDSWYEEDEEVFVHPRNPYVRVDALHSTRSIRIELDGITLAQASSPVLVFETGLPTRYYVNRSEIDFGYLEPTSTVSACPYKGTTSSYWSVSVAGTVHEDLAWAYDVPTRELLPIAGRVSFFNEKVDVVIDGERIPRPKTHFFEEGLST